jgi:DNA-binding MarR family transcriptional regulator
MSQLQSILLNEKPAKALISLQTNRLNRTQKKCVADVSKDIDSTFAHTVRTISKLEEKGLVDSHKQGRKKFLQLTEEGEEYADTLQELLGGGSGLQV